MEKPFSAYRGDGPFVFVCYSHEDSAAVFREIAWLNDYGVNVWYDEGIGPGQEWTEELASAIQGCTKVLYFVSPESVKSEHCRRELNFAQEEHREVVAIHLVPTEVPAGLRLSLNNRQAILKHELAEDEFHKRLVRVAHGGGGSVAPPTIASGAGTPRSRAGVLVAAIALSVIAVGAWWLFTRDGAPLGTEPVAVDALERAVAAEVLRNSIAVLPFANLSSDPEHAFFAAGIHEEVLNQLAKIEDLSVIARTTMVRYADADLTVPEIGKELKVQTVMEGSVRYAGNRVRIAAQLIDAASGAQLWSEAYEEDLEDIFGIQLAIATRVANTLEAELSPIEQRRIGRPSTANTEAYGQYLRAMAGWGNLASFKPIHDALDNAISLDPEFASAIAFKAWIHAIESAYGGRFLGPGFDAEDQEQLIVLAERLAKRALEIDGDQSRAYLALVFVHQHNRNWQAANDGADRAYTLSPNDYIVVNAAAWAANVRGNIEAAIGHMERSIELNPADAANIWNFSQLLYSAEQWEEAATQANLVTTLLPDLALGYAQLALVESRLGDHEAARRNGALAEARNPGIYELASIAEAYGQIGDLEEARRIFDLAGGGDESRVPDPGWQFRMHMAVKEYDTAMRYLERAVQGNFPYPGSITLHYNSAHPEFDPIRARPKFDELVRQVAIPLKSSS